MASERYAHLVRGRFPIMQERRQFELRYPDRWLEAVPGWQQVPASVEQGALSCATTIEWKFRFAFPVAGRTLFQGTNGVLIAPRPIGIDVKAKMDVFGIVLEGLRSKCCEVLQLVELDDALIFWEEPVRC